MRASATSWGGLTPESPPAGPDQPARCSAAVEDDDAARDLTSLHGAEGVVDIVEGDPTADEPVQVEPAGPVERQQSREIALGIGRAVHASEDGLGVDEQLHGREG